MALNVHRDVMTTDTALYFATAVRLAGVNGFYRRRVMQRCQRGEITLLDAAKLLMAAAQRGEAETEIVGVRTIIT